MDMVIYVLTNIENTLSGEVYICLKTLERTRWSYKDA